MDSESSKIMDQMSSKTTDRSSETIVLAALQLLQRPFNLGMLYDCRSDQLISDLRCWEEEDLKRNTRSSSRYKIEFETVESLNIGASLKASCMGKLIDIDSSAKDLMDCKTSQNQARVILKYKNTTGFRQLSKLQQLVSNSGTATHVVIGILYGVQAEFVFDCEVSEEENRQDIEENLKAVISTIPYLVGHDSVQMKDTDVAKFNNLSCKFHGNFSPKKDPVSFNDAIEVFQSLPQLLKWRANGENSILLKVQLMPLTDLDSKAAQRVCQISNSLKMEAQSFLKDFNGLELRLKSPVIQQFPHTTLAEKLPLIRRDEEEESVQAEVLKRRHSSPFNIKDITHSSVTFKLNPPTYEVKHITEYSIEYFTDSWQKHTPSKAGEVTVSNLSPNTEYKFRSRAVCPVGRGPASDSDSMTHKSDLEDITHKTLPTSPPGKPQVEAYSDQLFVNWEKPTELGDGVTVESYSVEYAKEFTGKKHGQRQWNEVTSKDEKANITGLEPMTKYIVRVRCECGVAGRSKESIEVPVKTEKAKKERLADIYKKITNLVNFGSPSIYKLSLDRTLSTDGCKSYSFGKERKMHENRTIMMLGATGAGKTTLINGMINYILGINWNDDFRFQLINEKPRSQAESQTSEVIAYKINHEEGFKVPYSLTVIDTPGFGDTCGIKRDEAITEKIHSLITSKMGISGINAVCFVTQAPLARLTSAQTYVFNSVLSIFGKDIAENFLTLVTFSDGKQPPVLEAINVSNIPFPKTKKLLPIHFKFNNSALFANSRSSSEDMDESFDQMFWEMGMKSFKHFFAALHNMETKSLLLSKELLEERKRLETAVEGIKPQVKAEIAKLEEVRMMNQKIKEHEAAICLNANFKFEVEFVKQKMIPAAGSRNCQQCLCTCHTPCNVKDDTEKYLCLAIDKNGHCTVCPRKCVGSAHSIQEYKWAFVKEKMTITVLDLKDKYEKASQGKMSVQDLIKRQADDIENIEDIIVSLVETVAACLARLNEIALRPNPLSAPDYIELLIEEENSEAKEGYITRIQYLEAMKEQAKIKFAKHRALNTESEMYKSDWL